MKLEIKNRWAVKSSVNLRGANLYGADLYRANLRDADLRGANLYRANLRNSNLRDANLRGADLYRANLRDANLYGANLYRANLYGANLRDANLYRANFRDADLRGANLYRANLYGVRGFSKYKTTPLYGLYDQVGKIRAYKLVNCNKEGLQYGGLKYKIGKTVRVDDANTDELVDCGAGINLATLDWCMYEWREGCKILLVEFTAKDIACVPTRS